MQERIQAWCVNSPHTITKGDVYSLLTDARFEVEEKPKYDPFRLFKKGDRVRIVKCSGRCYTTFWEPFVGVEMYVKTSETAYSLPEVETAKGLQPIDPAYLELVTPVEELNPYSVHESEVIQGFDIVRDKLCVMTFPFGAKECGWYYNRLAAKEAAEAERDRLNAEYRKEQNNG